MRTVTFSDPAVAKFVNEKFVCAWKNRNQKFHNCEFGQEQQIATYRGEIFATRNISTNLLDAKGSVLHTFRGYYAPTRYLDELQFALKVHADPAAAGALHSTRRKSKTHETAETRRTKPRVSSAFRKEIDRLLKLFPGPAGPDCPGKCADPTDLQGNAALQAMCNYRRDYVAEGLNHHALVHRWFTARIASHKRLPTLSEALEAHNGANPFAEE